MSIRAEHPIPPEQAKEFFEATVSVNKAFFQAIQKNFTDISGAIDLEFIKRNTDLVSAIPFAQIQESLKYAEMAASVL